MPRTKLRYQDQTTVLADGKCKIVTMNGKNGTPSAVPANVLSSLAKTTNLGTSTTAVDVSATRLMTAKLLVNKPLSGTRHLANAFVSQSSAQQVEHGASRVAAVNASSIPLSALEAKLSTFNNAAVCASPVSAQKEKNSSQKVMTLNVDATLL